MTLWFRNAKNNDRWNLSNADGNNTRNGCFITSTTGFGINKKIEKTQVGADYIVTAIKNNAMQIKFTLVFKNQKHFNNFIKFYQESKGCLELDYDPAGKTIYSDLATPTWYRDVIISMLNLTGQRDTDGWIKVPCVLDLLSDVWYKKITIVKNKVESSPSEQLVYPEFYTYFYGGKNRLAIKLDNPGMETGCKIVVKNISKVNIDNIQWHLINSFFDETHKEVSTLQKCRFNVMIRPGESISVDSNAINQQASLVSGNNSFNIARFQEADFDFINFCRLEHGKNNLVFLTDVLDLEISIEYTLATELAF